MQKKAALGLSIETLVIIIISLVILGGGITLLYKFIGGAEEIKRDLDARTEAELEHLLIDQGKKVALPLNTATVRRGENHVFGIGMLNIESERQKFRITVELAKVVDNGEQDITASINRQEIQQWLLYNKEDIVLEQNEHRQEGILVHVPETVGKGTYIFRARIVLPERFDGKAEQYGNTQIFTVTVI